MKHLQHWSIHKILMLLFSAVILLVAFFIGKSASLLLTRYSVDNALTSTQQLLSASAVTMNTYFSSIDDAMFRLAASDTVVDVCTRPVKNLDDYTMNDLNEVRNIINTSKSYNQPYISYSLLVKKLPDGPALITSDSEVKGFISVYQVIEEVSSVYEHCEYSRCYPCRPFFPDPSDPTLLFPFYRPVRNFHRYDPTNYAVVCAFISSKQLDSIFSEMSDASQYSLFLVNSDNEVYYSNDHQWIGRPYDDYLAALKAVKTEGNCYLDHSGRPIAIECRTPSSFDHHTLILVSNLVSLNHQLSILRRTIFSSVAVFVMLAMVITYFVARKITNPLTALAHIMEQKRFEELNQKASTPNSCLELTRLYQGYNHMLDQISSQLNELYFSKLRQKEAEFEALQSKINPHFLYNTLQSISSLAVLGMNSEIESIIHALSGMLEYLTYDSSSEVPLYKEVHYAQEYVQIQQMRYNNRFTFSAEISPETNDCILPKLLVQPLIENSIIHGLANTRRNGQLCLRTCLQDGVLQIEVSDNGCGISADAMDRIQRYIASPNKNSDHKRVGLSNVSERIHLKYGSRYGLTIHSEEGHGTMVRITLPAVK